MEIRTPRLLLREYAEHDFDDMFAFESDPLVVQYVCYGPFSKEECWQQLTYHIAHQQAEPRTYYHLAIVLPQAERVIGWCGLELTGQRNKEAEIGYALNRRHWGQGYMTEAAQAMLKKGFETMNLHRIFAACHPANAGSIRVLEKLGMRYEGCLRAQKSCRGAWRDVAIYALLEDEWKVSMDAHLVENTSIFIEDTS